MAHEAAPGNEVAREALASIPRIANILGVELRDLYRGAEDAMTQSRISWGDFVRIKENIEEIAGSDERVLELGQYILEPDGRGGMIRAIGLFVRPKYLILASSRIVKRLFSNLEIYAHEEADGRICIEVLIPEPYQACRTFFLLSAGALASLPLQIGLPPSQVEWDTDGGRRGVFLVTPPPSPSLWLRLKTTWDVIRNTQASVMQLHQGEVELAAWEKMLSSTLRERTRVLDEREQTLEREKQNIVARDHLEVTMAREARKYMNSMLYATRIASEHEAQETGELSSTVLQTSFRLYRVIDVFLLYKRLAVEDIKWEPSAYRIEDLVRAILSQEYMASTAYDLASRVHIECNESCLNWWALDLTHIVWVVQELIFEALETSPEESPVECHIEVGGGMLHIEIKDRGYRDLKDTAIKFKIDGGPEWRWLVHLVIRGTLEKIGGHYLVESTVRNGTRAIIEVPISPVDAPKVIALGRRVLVVDDDAVHQRVAKRLLERLDCSVTLASDGEEALELIRKEPFDLIFADCDMPRMNGWEVTEYLRKSGNSIPIVATTACTSSEGIRRCKEAGMNDIVAKPLEQGLVSVVIEKWLSTANNRC